MQPAFYIDISIHTVDGPKRIGRFDLGKHREEALSLFKSLKGSSEINVRDMLYVEFMESVRGLPVNIDIITCDLRELGTNTMLITQELFRLANLKHK
jgi:hypothetical protein